MGFKNRILVEKAVMSKIFPGARFSWEGNSCKFELWYTTTASGNQYLLSLKLSEYFPDSMPELYVISPVTLWKHGYSSSINSLGVSHDYHTNSNGPGGCVQICHFKSEYWDASKTSVAVFVRGLIWLESYDIHLKTGMSINEIISNLKRRQESWTEKEIDYNGLLRIWQGEEIQPINLNLTNTRNHFDQFQSMRPLGEYQEIWTLPRKI